jgi:hypothetical protein
MAKGVANFTLPTADEVKMGESKVYGNYGLPLQKVIGALKGGVKTTITREIKEIEFDGAYGPVKGLRRTSKMTAQLTLSNLVLKYDNIVKISDCESDGLWESNDWGGTGGTFSAETTIVNSGSQSSKMTADTDGYGIHEVFASSKDLTVFGNSIASTTADKIGFAIYITTQDLTDLGTADLRIALHMDSEGTETNYYYYDVEVGDLTSDQWNTFTIAKSSFTEQGTGDWSAVTGISMKLNGSPSAEVIAYIDSIDLIQDQTAGTIVAVKGNGGEFSYTDEGDYRKFTASLEIEDDDYYENVVVLNKSLSGKVFLIMIKNAYNDGNISLSLAEKDEAVNETQFTAHYLSSAKTTVPVIIRDYDIEEV